MIFFQVGFFVQINKKICLSDNHCKKFNYYNISSDFVVVLNQSKHKERGEDLSINCGNSDLPRKPNNKFFGNSPFRRIFKMAFYRLF